MVFLRLFALTVKYTLHPLSVEDVIEQCQTKIDRLGGHYFLTIEPTVCMVTTCHIASGDSTITACLDQSISKSSILLETLGLHLIFLRLLTLVDAGDTNKGLHPVRVRGQHVAAFCSGPPQLDTLITVAQARFAKVNRNAATWNGPVDVYAATVSGGPEVH